MFIENQSLEFQFSEGRVGYLKCSKEDLQNSDSWVQVKPQAMEEEKLARVTFTGTRSKRAT